MVKICPPGLISSKYLICWKSDVGFNLSGHVRTIFSMTLYFLCCSSSDLDMIDSIIPLKILAYLKEGLRNI